MYDNICLILNLLSVTVHVFYVPKTHRWFPLYFIAVGRQILNCLLILFSAAMCISSLFKGFFVGAKSLVLQNNSQFMHVLHTQPNSRTF